MPHPGKDMGVVTLDFHPPAAAETLLAAPEFVVEKRLIHGQSGWKAGNERDQRFSVGFSRSEVAKHELWILSDSRRIAEFRAICAGSDYRQP
jgi:hypothetical protein